MERGFKIHLIKPAHILFAIKAASPLVIITLLLFMNNYSVNNAREIALLLFIAPILSQGFRLTLDRQLLLTDDADRLKAIYTLLKPYFLFTASIHVVGSLFATHIINASFYTILIMTIFYTITSILAVYWRLTDKYFLAELITGGLPISIPLGIYVVTSYILSLPINSIQFLLIITSIYTITFVMIIIAKVRKQVMNEDIEKINFSSTAFVNYFTPMIIPSVELLLIDQVIGNDTTVTYNIIQRITNLLIMAGTANLHIQFGQYYKSRRDIPQLKILLDNHRRFLLRPLIILGSLTFVLCGTVLKDQLSNFLIFGIITLIAAKLFSAYVGPVGYILIITRQETLLLLYTIIALTVYLLVISIAYSTKSEYLIVAGFCIFQIVLNSLNYRRIVSAQS